MNVTSADLLARANAFAGPRYGVRVTLRMLRDWVDEGYVPGPRGRGRGRGLGKAQDWPSLAYRRILQLARLKGAGVTRRELQLAILWLGGAEYPPERVREALIAEVGWLRRAARAPLPVGWDRPASQRQRGAVLKAMGAADPVPLATGGGLSLTAVLALGASMVGGVPLGSRQGEVARGLLPRGVRDGVTRAGLMPELLGDLSAFAGLLADPQELPGGAEEVIATAAAETLRNTCDWVRAYPRLLATFAEAIAHVPAVPPEIRAALASLAAETPELRTPVARLILLAQFLARARLKGDQGRGIGELARRGVPMLREWLAQVPKEAGSMGTP